LAGAASSMGSGGPGVLSPEMAVAATSVVTSLGGALMSLAQPAAIGAASTVASQVVPHLSSFMSDQPARSGSAMRSTTGTSANDYSDLPPFEEAETGASGSKK